MAKTVNSHLRTKAISKRNNQPMSKQHHGSHTKFPARFRSSEDSGQRLQINYYVLTNYYFLKLKKKISKSTKYLI
jgi:hypothetical protein